MKKVLLAFFLIPLLFTGCAKKGEEVAGADGQTFLKVTVLEDNVDLRYHPREESTLCDKKLNKGDIVYVAGLDQKESVVDDKKGYWVQVFTEFEHLISPYWVFSTKIEAGKNLLPNTISFESESISENGKISVSMKDKLNKVSKHEVQVQRVGDFYSFTWGPWDDGFNYSDQVGTFIFYPSDKSIARFSSVEAEQPSMWTKPSHDLKYVFADGGTSTGLRGIVVYEAATGERVFGGSYYGSMDYPDAYYSDGKIVCVKSKVYSPEDAGVSDFVANNPMPEDIKDSPLTKIVLELYEHDLVTGEEKPFGHMYAVQE